MTWIEWARVGAVLLVLLAALQFCVLYHKKTRGTWRKTVYGVHMMAFSGAFVFYMAYAVVSLLVIPEAWRPYIGVILFLSLASLFRWRTQVLKSAQRVLVPTEPKETDTE